MREWPEEERRKATPKTGKKPAARHRYGLNRATGMDAQNHDACKQGGTARQVLVPEGMGTFLFSYFIIIGGQFL
ncbi:hypothetical protein I532_08132 [Brevibacillus borstelensis AK1]|uniref:Uncharacterized protein n=1 Tax=Brevibacillus borstelensis AK1 TaxID=1300222 RepID=M8DGZ8_9BACL|nr:hypothetical protein I532_08132 [Brevibacillus borstelensis AK1]KKX55831.1 hypothetical protein X546_09300 [Brevibacillus borstelensis cifa_chp40]